MSVDRPPKRKTASKRDSVSPKTPAKKKRSNSPTADNLEALLHLLDDEATVNKAAAAERQTGKPTGRRPLQPPRETPPSPGGTSSFMQELARARADLHKERRTRIALEEEVASVRRELTRLAANESDAINAVHHECEGLKKQLADVDKQRQKLQGVRLDLESQLDAEQKQREQLEDQLDAINDRLAAECSRRESLAGELEAARQECTRQTIEADAARSSWEAAGDELRAELASMSSRCEQMVQSRDTLQATAVRQESEIAALIERVAVTETMLRERDELIQQARNAVDDGARSASEWEKRFLHEHATWAQAEQQLLAELTSVKHAKRQAAVSLEETASANERLERRVNELEAEVAAGNQRLAQGQNELGVANERIERFDTEIAKTKTDLAEAYEQLGASRLRLANMNRDRDHAQQREAEALHKANAISDEVTSLKAAVQREAAARRKAEAVHKRESGDDQASALFEAEQRIERLSRELAASKSVESAYQQKAARKVQQVQQELETLRRRLAEIEQRPEGR